MLYRSSNLHNALVLILAFVLAALVPAQVLRAADVTPRNSTEQTPVAQVQPEEAPPTLVIGASEQNELALLTEMSILLLEEAGFEVVHLHTSLETSIGCFERDN